MAKYFLVSCLMVIAQFGMAQQSSDSVIPQNSIEDSLAWGNVTPEQVEGLGLAVPIILRPVTTHPQNPTRP